MSPSWHHAPLHALLESGAYMITAGTYEKQHHLCTKKRLDAFVAALHARRKGPPEFPGLAVVGHQFERPVKVGDRIDVGEIEGVVADIRARSTTVITNDNIAIIVPNSKFVMDNVVNWSYTDPKIRFRIPVGVAYVVRDGGAEGDFDRSAQRG